MAEDFYSDTPDNAPVPEDKEASDSNIALLPKGFFPPDKDVKPGSICKIRVAEDQGDQVLVAYERDEPGDEDVPVEPEMAAPAPPVDEELSGYMR